MGRIWLSAAFWFAVGAMAAAQVAVTSSGYATLVGPAVPVAPVSAPLVYAPQITLVPGSVSAVGASNATAGNVAGATNSTLNNVAGATSASSLIPLYNYGPAPLPGGYPQIAAPIAPEQAPQPYAVVPAPEPAFHAGVMTSDSAYNSTAGSRLAVVAREWRQREQMAANIPTYTNEDIARVEQKSGVSKPAGFRIPANTGGSTGAAISGMSVMPGAPGTPENELSENAGGSTGAEEQTRSSSTAPPAQPAAPSRGNGAAGTKVQQPRVPQASQLPTTSTELPAVALFGLVTLTAGLLVSRK